MFIGYEDLQINKIYKIAKGITMIEKTKKINSIYKIVTIFIICMSIRAVDYWLIRTDQTIIAENFIHKVLGIVLIVICIRIFSYTLSEIGFCKTNAIRNTFYGITMGLIFFTIAYSIEFIILSMDETHASLELYISGFSFVGLPIKNIAINFFIMCFVFNMINVLMEEGMFRGLFNRLANQTLDFTKSTLLIALLFGIWHFILPLRSYTDGDMSLYNMIIMNIGYIVFSGVMSIKWTLLYKMTGSLWFSMGDHFVNNTLTNILHITTPTGSDELQIVRIIIAQLLSSAVVIFWYLKHKKNNH